MWTPAPEDPLHRLFAGMTEHAFYTELGITDTPLIDYVTNLLTRFLHVDESCLLRDEHGQPLDSVVDMIRTAEALPAEGRTRREIHRYIGDYTLFWSGLYPETLRKRQAAAHGKDHFLDYCRQGKHSYTIAGSFDSDPWREEAEVLRRLGTDFEMCAYGLNQVRREFDAASH
jgi:hypothetical protein